jgi:hypothetical protein
MTEDDDSRGVPCCAAEAARRVTKVRVGQNLVGILEFGRIMDEVQRMGPMGEEETKDQLLRRTKVYNYVPAKAENDYAEAMLREFEQVFDDEED